MRSLFFFTVDLFVVRTDFAEQDAGVVETEVRVLAFLLGEEVVIGES